MKSSLTLRTREAGRTWPITRREQKGPESTKTRRKERRRKPVSVLNTDTWELFHSGEKRLLLIISINVFFLLHPLAEIKEEEKTKDSSAEKTDSKR